MNLVMHAFEVLGTQGFKKSIVLAMIELESDVELCCLSSSMNR